MEFNDKINWDHFGPELAKLVAEMMRALDNESDVEDDGEGRQRPNAAMRFQMTGATMPGNSWHERSDHVLQFLRIDWRKEES